jgi:competence protein ComFC
MSDSFKLTTWLTDAFQGFLEFLFPTGCAGCGVVGRGFLCEDCLKHVHYIDQPRCSHCSIPLGTENSRYCSRCRELRSDYNNGISIAIYEDPLGKLIRNLKFNREIGVADFLAELVVKRAKVDTQLLKLFNCDLIHPIPLAKPRAANRGFNQSALIAKLLAKQYGIEYCDDSVVRVRDTRSMIGLGYTERLSNIRNAFEVRKPEQIEAKSVLLVDDVMTTGATIEECARTLKMAGSGKVTFLAIARQLIGDDWEKIESF